MTRAERIAELEAELTRLKAEEEAERGLVEGEDCWAAKPDGTITTYSYFVECPFPCFPLTDDGKRRAERAALLMSSLNFEDPPFEALQKVWMVTEIGNVMSTSWTAGTVFHSLWHQGRIRATEAEALAWRDQKNGAWTGTLVGVKG